jgi:hypothetical protein
LLDRDVGRLDRPSRVPAAVPQKQHVVDDRLFLNSPVDSQWSADCPLSTRVRRTRLSFIRRNLRLALLNRARGLADHIQDEAGLGKHFAASTVMAPKAPIAALELEGPESSDDLRIDQFRFVLSGCGTPIIMLT